FFFVSCAHHLFLHSFPTRRSSDLLLGFIAIVGVIIMQLFLLNQAYSFEKKESEAKIFYALHDVVEKIHRDNKTILPATNHIKKVDRKSTRLNSSHVKISYAVFCLK